MIRILAILLIVGIYISFRLYRAFFSKYKIYVTMPIIFIITQSFFIFKVIEKIAGFRMSESIMDITYIIFGITVYLVLYFLIFDILWLFRRKLQFLYDKKYKIGVIVVALSLATFLYGYFHQLDTKTKYFEVATDKSIVKPLKMVVIADIHIGSGMTVKRLNKHVEEVNNMNPDVVFLVGDIIDNDIRAFTDDFREAFRNINAPTYAVLGNHEYFGGNIDNVISAMEDAGMVLLKDEVVFMEDYGVYIVGRDSIRHSVSSGDERKSIGDLLEGIDTSKPVIVLDHIPRSIDDVKSSNVDIQFSGHTHGGQFFPVTEVVKMMYPISAGLLKDNNFNLIVTSGLGLWGPPMRVGSDSEILFVTLKEK